MAEPPAATPAPAALPRGHVLHAKGEIPIQLGDRPAQLLLEGSLEPNECSQWSACVINSGGMMVEWWLSDGE